MVTALNSPFCERCQLTSSREPAPSIRSNTGIGKSFYGRLRPCPTCGSAIRTLWWIFVTLPVVPLGSYRVISFEEEAAHGRSVTAFVSRRVPLQWPQVARTWSVGCGGILFLLWLLLNRAR